MPAGKWEASNLQAVVFLRKAIPTTDIFSALISEAPESQEERPREGVRIESGPFSGGSLQVIVSPIRVDIVLSPVPGADALLGASQTLGDFAAQLDAFAAVIRKWLRGCGLPTLRLALVARAMAPADSPTSAYEILKDNLTSVHVKPGEMRDMMFRVNWRAPSALISEKYLNRLTTWASLTVATRGALSGGPPMDTIEKYYAYREIDVNTPADHSDELPAEQLVPIFDEIYQIAVSTAETGEQP